MAIVIPVAPSVSGTGEGVVLTVYTGNSDVKGKLTDTGEIVITGSKISDVGFWVSDQITKLLPGVIKDKLIVKSSLLHWTDVLAVCLVAETKFVINNRNLYKAGKRELDTLGVVMIMDDIANSGRSKDWNSIMRAKQLADPVESYTEQEIKNTPFTSESPYWNGGKAVFKYDQEAGIIIWIDGQILWTKTNQIFYAKSEPVLYGYDGPIVEFKNGERLNLSTLVWINTKTGEVKTVRSVENSTFNRIIQKLLTDTKTQFLVLASLIFLLVLKNKNAR